MQRLLHLQSMFCKTDTTNCSRGNTKESDPQTEAHPKRWIFGPSAMDADEDDNERNQRSTIIV